MDAGIVSVNEDKSGTILQIEKKTDKTAETERGFFCETKSCVLVII